MFIFADSPVFRGYRSGNIMKKALSILLIFFTLALFYNNVLNRHFHRLPNGIVIEHAHPFQKGSETGSTPFQKHNHSDIEYLLLDIIYSGGVLIILGFSGLLIFLQSVQRAEPLRTVPVYCRKFIVPPPLRGPPPF
jgi:hypothetical protein